MKKIIIWMSSLLAFLGLCIYLYSWVIDTNIKAGFDYPYDDAVVASPFTIFGWCWNEGNGIIDYYEIWQIRDKDRDGIIDDSELEDKTIVARQYGFDRYGKYHQQLAPTYSGRGSSGEYYFLFIYAKTLEGAYSWDGYISGLTKDGDSTHPDNCIVRFRVSGVRP